MHSVFRIVAFAFALLCGSALAQVVTPQPTFLSAGIATDLGNGPTEVRITQGSAALSTSSGSGLGSTSGSSTTLTLTATPATAPCVGCILSGTGITSGTTVTAFNGTTTITMSAAMTVAAATPIAWGAACPTPTPQATFPVLAAPSNDVPFYTQARVCAYAPAGAGAAALLFPVAGH